MYVLLMPLWEGFPYGVMQVRIEKIYIAVLVTPGNKLIITWGITPFCVHLPGGGEGVTLLDLILCTYLGAYLS